VALAHVLVRNSMLLTEALWASGANVYLSEAFPSLAAEPVTTELAEEGASVLPLYEEVEKADLCMDLGAVLGLV
jgi:hypothetical protein